MTVEDIYYRLKNKQIELSPKLLMQIQRERKLKQIKAKILMVNVSQNILLFLFCI